jgi:hypothetical protein
MTDNPDKEELDDLQSPLPEHSSDGNILRTEAEPISSNQEAQNMEVHHHGHVHEKKKWKEYAFQFFMLFLAVFCGFLAEYQLEQTIERHREKDYIKSFINNVKNDTVSINDFLKKETIRLLFLDSLLAMKNTDLTLPHNTWMVYYYFIRSRFYPIYLPNDATLMQLKNSGNFRLIKNTQVVDSILKYDHLSKYIIVWGNRYHSKIQHTEQAADLILDLSLSRDPTYYDYPKRNLIKQPPLITNNLEQIRSFFNAVSEEAAHSDNYMKPLKWQRGMAASYLRFIRKEHHLEIE